MHNLTVAKFVRPAKMQNQLFTYILGTSFQSKTRLCMAIDFQSKNTLDICDRFGLLFFTPILKHFTI